MVLRQRWVQLFSRHAEKHPDGVIHRLLADWEKAKAGADSLRSEYPPFPPPTHNRDSPGRMAQMLAERLRRRR